MQFCNKGDQMDHLRQLRSFLWVLLHLLRRSRDPLRVIDSRLIRFVDKVGVDVFRCVVALQNCQKELEVD